MGLGIQKMLALTTEYVPNPPHNVNIVQFRQETDKALTAPVTSISLFQTKSDEAKQKLLEALEPFAGALGGLCVYRGC
jgi:hypothetical protein